MILITYQEGTRSFVSHGVNTATMEQVVLPPVPPNEIGVYNDSIGEWVLKEVSK